MSETKPMSETLIERLRDRDSVVMSGLFHAIPTMMEAANEIEHLRAELASCRECRANLDCLSRGAVPVRDDGAERIRELETALESIRQFGSDTLSGRADGPDDREWQREGVHEMTARAQAALQPKDTAK